MTISKRLLAVVLLVAVAAALFVYFVTTKTKPTDLSFTLEQTSLATSETQSLSGTVSPADSGRLIIGESNTDGSWIEIGRTSTDASGVFKMIFPMAERGEVQVRVRVEQSGKQEAATAKPQIVNVLEPTQVQAQISRFARADRALKIPGRVTPAGERVVVVETSADGQAWQPAGETTSAASSGKFTVRAEDLTQGNLQIRVSVEESTTSASTSSDAKTISVEDYKAAGRQYLKIVEPVNKLIDRYNEASDNAGSDFENFQVAAAKLSRAETIQARQFRAYAYWPKEVRNNIKLMIQSCLLDADFMNQIAATENLDDANSLSAPQEPKGAANAAALIRAALGLPKRD